MIRRNKHVVIVSYLSLRRRLRLRLRHAGIIHQTTFASAMGATAQAAGRAASVLALDALQCNPEFLSRTCDCRESRRSNTGAQARIKRMLVEEIEDAGNAV
jgi:endoribonuclease Dicer